MKFVLIFLLFTDGIGSVSVTAEFDDQPACEAALEHIRQAPPPAKDFHYNGWISGKCYPKATK